MLWFRTTSWIFYLRMRLHSYDKFVFPHEVVFTVCFSQRNFVGMKKFLFYFYAFTILNIYISEVYLIKRFINFTLTQGMWFLNLIVCSHSEEFLIDMSLSVLILLEITIFFTSLIFRIFLCFNERAIFRIKKSEISIQ